MVDNFKQLEQLLDFTDPDVFYNVEILRRGKDHPDLPAANRQLKTYQVRNMLDWEKVKAEVPVFCKAFKARAYMCVEPKSAYDAMLKNLLYLTEALNNRDQKPLLFRIANTAISAAKSPEKLWVVDLDDCTDAGSIPEFLSTLSPEGDKVVMTVPTVTGIHLITKPFNRYELSHSAYSHLLTDIKTHALTLLYYP